MEGPSLVIATEELKPYFRRRIARATGQKTLPLAAIQGTSLQWARSWGKHLLLHFTRVDLRIHFLIFGSYRINDPREGRVPKLRLEFSNHDAIDFYSCAIKAMPKGFEKEYDHSIDLMSEEWDAKKALTAVRARPDAEVADVLMDQTIFAGLGAARRSADRTG